jgi:hypothetical protein
MLFNKLDQEFYQNYFIVFVDVLNQRKNFHLKNLYIHSQVH